MNPNFFNNLPSHITIDILSRLPVRTIIHCKCVCKPWLHLLNHHEFINHHLSKSAPALAVSVYPPATPLSLYEIYEFEDEQDLQHHDLHYNLVTNFKLPCPGHIEGSANGLLLLSDKGLNPYGLLICNPITREYVQIHSPQELKHKYPQLVTFGFGSSRETCQHKVVRILTDYIQRKFEFHVYTLGTRSWRSIEAPFMSVSGFKGAFLNGNLHWLVFDSNDSVCISCFDLETEVLTSVSAPPSLPGEQSIVADVFAFEGVLCVCDNSSEDEIVVWFMKEYGDGKSWTKEFIIKKSDYVVTNYDPHEIVRPIKIFKDGEILMAWGDFFLFYYSTKTRTMTVIKKFEAHRFGCIDSILHISSFLSLKSFGMEQGNSIRHF